MEVNELMNACAAEIIKDFKLVYKPSRSLNNKLTN